jgi:poly-gamma-glutamate synthesis protein (capsule biosynthesis protein)
MTDVTISTDPEPNRDGENILVAGDYVPRSAVTGGSLVSAPLADRISAASLAAINLEAPVRSTAKPLTKYGPTISLAPSAIDAAAATGFDLVQLANNHVMDYGEAGLRRTIEWCEEAGLRTVGAGETSEAALEPAIVETDRHRIGILNAGDREFGVATRAGAGYAWCGDPGLPDAIASASRNADVVVLLLHGGVEFEPIPAVQRQRRYRRFADAGADVIIGHHPHVPRGWEVYDGTPICYSLGHFLFDFRPKYRKPKTEWGLLADVLLDGDGVSELVLRPIEQSRSAPRVRHVRERDDRIDYLERGHAVLSDPAAHQALWQQLAVERYREYYGSRLDRSLLSRLRTDENRRYRWIQNVSQCEAHSWCVQTGTGVLGGAVEDVRRAGDA